MAQPALKRKSDEQPEPEPKRACHDHNVSARTDKRAVVDCCVRYTTTSSWLEAVFHEPLKAAVWILMDAEKGPRAAYGSFHAIATSRDLRESAYGMIAARLYVVCCCFNAVYAPDEQPPRFHFDNKLPSEALIEYYTRRSKVFIICDRNDMAQVISVFHSEEDADYYNRRNCDPAETKVFSLDINLNFED